MTYRDPACYVACGERAAPGRRFCSDHCAAFYAEAVAGRYAEQWCVTCDEWKAIATERVTLLDDLERLECGHLPSGITGGAPAPDPSPAPADESAGPWRALARLLLRVTFRTGPDAGAPLARDREP